MCLRIPMINFFLLQVFAQVSLLNKASSNCRSLNAACSPSPSPLCYFSLSTSCFQQAIPVLIYCVYRQPLPLEGNHKGRDFFSGLSLMYVKFVTWALAPGRLTVSNYRDERVNARHCARCLHVIGIPVPPPSNSVK